jgi:hypothetical protein
VRDLNQFNEYVYSVIQDDIRNEWMTISQSYALSFLLYHDFMERFTNNVDLNNVMPALEKALKKDIEYIKNSIGKDEGSKNIKGKLLQKIETFVKANYPGIDYENLILSLMLVNKI